MRLSESLRRANVRLGELYEAQKPPVTLPQLAVLTALQRHGAMQQGGIVSSTMIDRSTVSGIVQRLAEKRLVKAVRVPGNLRAKRVEITGPGSKAYMRGVAALSVAEAELSLKWPAGLAGGLSSAMEWA